MNEEVSGTNSIDDKVDLKVEKPQLESGHLKVNGDIGCSQIEENSKTLESAIGTNALRADAASSSVSNVSNPLNASVVTNSKPKKRKKELRDEKAPKQPLTGYIRFLNDRREVVRTENPTKTFTEITRHLAAEWNSLASDKKQQYLSAAEQDKERYNKELEDYKQTDGYKFFLERQAAEKKKKLKKDKSKEKDREKDKDKEKNGPTNLEKNVTHRINKNGCDGYDIPIFTDEFLEHNKACEAELRQLRKSTTDYESQNAVLQRHVDSLRSAIERLDCDTNKQKTINQALKEHLDNIRSGLAICFMNIPLQDSFQGSTIENVDSYVTKIDALLNSNTMESSIRNDLCQAISRFDDDIVK